MFAFAFFDKVTGNVLLARDPFGIKPLFLFKTDQLCAFSSQIDGLLSVPQLVQPRLNQDNYVASLRYGGSDFDDTTLVQGIHHLLPGHILELTFCERSIRYSLEKYFHLGAYEPNVSTSFEEAKEQYRSLLDESVRRHMISDVPFCFNLSGGIDSSALVAVASQHKQNITAFTYEADEEDICEVRHAESVARHVGINLVKVRVDPEEFGQDVDDLIYDQGEPFGGCSIYAQRKLYEAQSRQGFKVCIDGQGGDEMFAGYTSYLAFRFSDLLSAGQYGKAWSFLRRINTTNANVSRKQILAYYVDNILKNYPKIRSSFRKFTNRDLCPFYMDKKFFCKYYNPFVDSKTKTLRDTLNDALFRSSIPHLLRYADRNAMSFSIENRVPFLTPKLAQFTCRLPNHYLISDTGFTKSILRESIRDLLPVNIVERRDKLGFPPTEGLWLMRNSPVIAEALNSDVAHRLPGIDILKLQNYWKQVVAKKDVKAFRSDIIWKVFNFIRWVQLFGIQISM
jgi:asparagine synthase (glutamine-hydrolysing)